MVAGEAPRREAGRDVGARGLLLRGVLHGVDVRRRSGLGSDQRPALRRLGRSGHRAPHAVRRLRRAPPPAPLRALLRGGRRRFGFGETGDARRAKEAKRDARRTRDRRAKILAEHARRVELDAGVDEAAALSTDADPSEADPSSALTDFERRRLAKVRANRAMFLSLAPPRRPPSAKERAASALVAAIARAAETSSAVAAAKRVETAAAAAAERAKVAAEDARRRERAARAAANVAAREADAATRVERDALAESLAARAMVVRLEERAREADAACDAAERLAQRSR